MSPPLSRQGDNQAVRPSSRPIDSSSSAVDCHCRRQSCGRSAPDGTEPNRAEPIRSGLLQSISIIIVHFSGRPCGLWRELEHWARRSEWTRCTERANITSSVWTDIWPPTLATINCKPRLVVTEIQNKKLSCRRSVSVKTCLSVVSVNSTILRANSSIISYFGIRFTTAYNYFMFCCLRRNVEEAYCHKHFVVRLSRSTNSAAYCYQRWVSPTCHDPVTLCL